ncbi:MAG: ABC transporter permease [Anaerolineae bacterium]|nr:ABC transporter permease [Anaerolineales bacterium]MCQ3974223.1 ABC transporter permease [Anaerolineae bacterium]
MRRGSLWAWLWVTLGGLYFILPLAGTFMFSLRAKRGVLSFLAYENVFNDPKFWQTFGFSALMAVLTILVSLLLIVPTAYWVQLRLPRLRPVIELMTLMPFVIPTIVLVFGLIRLYSRPPFALTGNALGANVLLVAGYVVLSFPYMYRAVDTGLRAIDVRTLTEAAQSLGAGWPTILFQVIFPNVRVALLSGAFLTFAIVIGEYVLAAFLARPAFAPYMALLGQNRAYEPAALSIISLALTWALIGLIQYIGRGQERSQLAGTH